MCHQQTLTRGNSSDVSCGQPVFLAKLIHSISQAVIFEVWYCPLGRGLVDWKKGGKCTVLGIYFGDLVRALEFSKDKEYEFIR
ncbi:MAG: hypothetical protein Q8N22_02435 [bacterium]|nr:hypothetical protein [bacterium]